MGYCSGALFILTVLLRFRGNISGSKCYELDYYRYYDYGYSYYYAYYTYYDYCTFGCCGYTTSRTCCTSYYGSYDYNSTYDSEDYSWIGVVAGSVVGGVVFFVVCATLIGCVCKSNNKNKVNRVNVQPAGQQGIATVSNPVSIPMQQLPGQTQGYPPPGYQPPQAYNPQSYPPPGYPGSSNDPSNIPSAWNNAPPATTQE